MKASTLLPRGHFSVVGNQIVAENGRPITRRQRRVKRLIVTHRSTRLIHEAWAGSAPAPFLLVSWYAAAVRHFGELSWVFFLGLIVSRDLRGLSARSQVGGSM